MSQDCRQHSRAKIDSNTEAVKHYFNGNGFDVELGERSKDAIIGNWRVELATTRLELGLADQAGKFDVDLTDSMFHVGRTKVWYSTSCNDLSCKTTFAVFGFDRFEDPASIGQTLGTKPVELPGGTPYRYKTFEWSIKYKNPLILEVK